MKAARLVGLGALLVAVGCGKGSDRRVSPDGKPDGGHATGGKSGGNGGTGGRPDLDAGPDAEGAGGASETDASTDGGGSGGKGAGGAGAGGAGAGGAGAGGASGSGGQGGTPPKTPSTDPAAPVDLAPGDVVQGTLGSADHFWRIPHHEPGKYGLILRSPGNVTVGLSSDPNGGLVQPGISGCETGTKGSCGQRVAGSFLTSGSPVAVFVFGPQGTTYELEVVPFTPLTGTPPTTGFSQVFQYETQFTGTVPTGDGAFTKAAPTTELYFWAKTEPATTEWFTLPGGFTCAARPYDTYQALNTNVTNFTVGTSSYAVNNGTPSFPSKPGAAFASNASVAISATSGGTTSSGTATSPTFTGEPIALFENEELLMEWLDFAADLAFLEFIAETGSTDVQVTCSKTVTGAAPADRKVTALDEDIKKQIEARNFAIYYWHMAVCTNSPIPEPILAKLFTVPQSVLMLCHALRMTPEQIAQKL